MKKYRGFCILLTLLLLLSVAICPIWADPDTTESTEPSETAADQTPEETRPLAGPTYPDYTALLSQGSYTAHCKAALLIERRTNTVIYALNSEEIVYPASLTKIMTCLIALEKCAEQGKSLDSYVTVSATAFDDLDAAGSTAGIQPGDRLTVRDLLYCMMLESANESCNIVAEYLAGSIDGYVEWMNARARELGCTNTHYVNTHGLHDPNHYTTAYDLAIITEAALANEEFTEIVRHEIHEVKSEEYSGSRMLASTNYLIRQAYPEYYYSKAMGVKTGYTSAAGRCLISTASNGNLELMAIILGAEDDDYAADGLRYRSFVEAKELFEFGFQNFAYVQVLSTLDMTAEVVVTEARDKNTVILYPTRDMTCLLPKNYDAAKITTHWSLYGGGTTLAAPVAKDEPVGQVTVRYDGVEIGTTELAALWAVEQQPKLIPNVDPTNYWWIIAGLLGLIALLLLVLMIRNAILRRRYREARRKRQQQRDEQ